MKTSLALLALLSAASAGAADIHYAGKEDCRIAVPARLAGQVPDWNGACSDGYASGPGALQWRRDGKDSERYEGNLLRGVADGDGVALRADGSLHDGMYRDGELHGAGIIVSADKEKLVATFEHGRPVGNVKWSDKNGNRYEGGWAHGPQGQGTQSFALGGSYSGQWLKGKPVGEGEIHYPNGQVLKGQFKGSFQLTGPQDEPVVLPLYQARRSEAYVGSHVPEIAGSGLIAPPEKNYAQLTPEQQRVVKHAYGILQEDDAPPYPAQGLNAIVRSLGTITTYLFEGGKVSANVSVDEQGRAVSVAILEAANREAGEKVASLLMLTKYTPGRCAGQPCAMMVPFRYVLDKRN